MNRVFTHRLSYGFEGHALDHYLRNYILRLRFHLPKLGLAPMGVVRFLLTLESALKNIRLIH